jgi:hypothetical protein
MKILLLILALITGNALGGEVVPVPMLGAGDPKVPPVAVSGIAGVTFLTTDLAPLRRFYGIGAGLAEVPDGLGRARFMVGAGQWIEFAGGIPP